MRFSFGKNWQTFSHKALNQKRINQAYRDFYDFLSAIDLNGKSFIDIGFGQGLSLIIAAKMGAEVLGIDIDHENLEALDFTKKAMNYRERLKTQIISILDESFIQKEKLKGGFDIVHSWGVLHHTGNMRKAIKNSCKLVKEGGYFVCSIYNRHWSSPFWKIVKYFYNKSSQSLQHMLVILFYPIIYIAKWMVTQENPKKKKRGMDFYHDVVDWIGGYPYEYASIEEIKNLVSQMGFQCVRVREAQVPTGCNEFVFRKL